MSRTRSRVTRVFATAAAMLSAAACAPERSPTVPAFPEDASLAAGGNGGGGGGSKVKIKTLRLASTTLTVDGPSVAATISLGNSGPPFQDGVSIQAEVAQPAAFREAANVEITCVPGDPGLLPNGNCTLTFDVSASSSANGAGTFVSGPAVLSVRIVHTANGSTTQLATKSINVDLNVAAAGPPTITSITPAFQGLMINGRTESVSIAIDNPGPERSPVLVRGWIIQGGVREEANLGQSVECEVASGLLPTGACTTLASVSVRSTLPAPFNLTPGAATLEIELTQLVDTTKVRLDTMSIPVTLVEATPWLVGSTVPSTITIGTNVQISVVMTNPTPNTYPNSTIVVNVLQGGNWTQVLSTPVTCGEVGVIQRGDCVDAVTINLGSSFIPGAATVEIRLYTESGTKLLDSRLHDVTLTS